MAITAAEIGRRVGCSTATVSRALSSKGSVSAKTREAILKAAREIKAQTVRGQAASPGGRHQKTGAIEVIFYRRSPFERLELHGQQMTVGPLAEHVVEGQFQQSGFALSHSFYRQLVDASVAEVARWGGRAMLQICQSLMDEEFLADLSRPDRSGVILVGEPTEDLGQFIARCPHPLVLVDIVYGSWPDMVTTDNMSGISQAFDHLYALGHRRIGFVGRTNVNFAYRERFTAFRLKMAEAELPVRNDWVYEGYSHIEQATEGVKKLVGQTDRPSALVCSNDCVALGAMRAASELHLRIPDDLSIVGFDDMEASAMVTPPLTTVRVPVAAIGRQAIRQLMIQIQAGVPADARGTCTRLMPELVVRGSTRRCS